MRAIDHALAILNSPIVAAAVAAAVGSYIAQKVRAVHTIVNAQRTEHENRIAQLEATIVESDKEIPQTTRETGSGHVVPPKT